MGTAGGCPRSLANMLSAPQMSGLLATHISQIKAIDHFATVEREHNQHVNLS